MRQGYVVKSLFRRAIALAALGGLAVAAVVADQWLTLGRHVTSGIAVVAGLGLLVLLQQVLKLRKRAKALLQIERQLAEFVIDGETAHEMFEAVPNVDAVAAGWNAHVSSLEQRGTLERLERSLAKKLSSGAGSGMTVLNGLGEGVAVTDLDGRVTMLNEAMAAVLGIENSHTVNGRPFQDLLHQVAGDSNATALSELSGSMRPVTFDLQKDTDESPHVLRCSRRPHYVNQDKTAGHVWTIRDVTQQRLAEQMRETFVATASHELRTPLANIRAYAETLAISEGIDVQKQKEFCNTILGEATRLARFVDELLDVTRLQAGSLALEKHETDLERFLQDVCAKLDGQIEQKQIDFEAEFPPKLPKILADKDKLAAALVNLLGNAVKYTPDGGKVRFRVENDSRQISFIVEDTGIGIAEEELPKVFDKFFRSDDDRVQSIVGNGLGLAFTKEVARLHGGDIDVTSEFNKGSRFTLSIPLSQEAN